VTETRAQDPSRRWSATGAGRRYATERWRSARHRERDPRLVGRALARRLAGSGLVLDAPCGTGRLRAAIEAHGRWVGLDVSAEMLNAHDPPGTRLRGDVEHLPFRDDAFEAVVCCRLLHHLDDPERLERTIAELVRVSARWIVASFWDAASLPEWRRGLGTLPTARRPRRDAHPRTRVARGKRELKRAFERADATVVGWEHSFRFVSRQAFAIARKRRDA